MPWVVTVTKTEYETRRIPQPAKTAKCALSWISLPETTMVASSTAHPPMGIGTGTVPYTGVISGPSLGSYGVSREAEKPLGGLLVTKPGSGTYAMLASVARAVP